jgi:hypothetical protein
MHRDACRFTHETIGCVVRAREQGGRYVTSLSCRAVTLPFRAVHRRLCSGEADVADEVREASVIFAYLDDYPSLVITHLPNHPPTPAHAHAHPPTHTPTRTHARTHAPRTHAPPPPAPIPTTSSTIPGPPLHRVA